MIGQIPRQTAGGLAKSPTSASQRVDVILRISRSWIPLISGIQRAEPTFLVGTHRRVS